MKGEPLKAGDMVMLVWACCATGREHLGWTGKLESIHHVSGCICVCGTSTTGLHGMIDIGGIGGRGVVPLSWLKKIEPPENSQRTDQREEITA